jgi:hypothetical protein
MIAWSLDYSKNVSCNFTPSQGLIDTVFRSSAFSYEKQELSIVRPRNVGTRRISKQINIAAKLLGHCPAHMLADFAASFPDQMAYSAAEEKINVGGNITNRAAHHVPKVLSQAIHEIDRFKSQQDERRQVFIIGRISGIE